MVEIGEVAPDFKLYDSNGVKHKLSQYRGKCVLLSFNGFGGSSRLLNIDRFEQKLEFLQKHCMEIINVFPSVPISVELYVKSFHHTPGTILCDPDMKVYNAFQDATQSQTSISSRSWIGSQKQKLDKNASCKSASNIKDVADKTKLPSCTYLIDTEGRVTDIYVCKKGIDEIAWDRVEEVIPDGHKCRCNSEHCLSKECRANNQIIMQNCTIFGM